MTGYVTGTIGDGGGTGPRDVFTFASYNVNTEAQVASYDDMYKQCEIQNTRPVPIM
jgi:hypothetical protein